MVQALLANLLATTVGTDSFQWPHDRMNNKCLQPCFPHFLAWMEASRRWHRKSILKAMFMYNPIFRSNILKCFIYNLPQKEHDFVLYVQREQEGRIMQIAVSICYAQSVFLVNPFNTREVVCLLDHNSAPWKEFTHDITTEWRPLVSRIFSNPPGPSSQPRNSTCHILVASRTTCLLRLPTSAYTL